MRAATLCVALVFSALACSTEASPTPTGRDNGDPAVKPPSKDPPVVGDPEEPEEAAPPATCTGAPGELYELSVRKLAQVDEVKLCTLEGHVLLIVNGASGCGYTPQYAPLQELYDKYKDQKFEVLAFPSKSFNQEKETDEEVSTFCTDKYHITFPLFTIGPVIDNTAKGETAQPVYRWLREQPGMSKPVAWNFEKFLVSRDGKAVKRFASSESPATPEFEDAIKAELAKP